MNDTIQIASTRACFPQAVDLNTRPDASLINSALSVINYQLAPCPQPISDVAAYLAHRQPQPEIDGEENLLITLPDTLQKETRDLVRAGKYAAALVRHDGFSVQRACIAAIQANRKWLWNLKTFRAKFDEWIVKKDWTLFVNRSKAPASWRANNSGLPAAFLACVETLFAKFKRSDGKRQALMSLKRNWTTGRNESGDAFVIPGYETNWGKRNPETFPVGWDYSNILRQIKARGRFTKPVRALLHDGESAARQSLPQILGDRSKLRFLEEITFDDVRMDWLVFNTETGQGEELWLLVARDTATGMVLGFVMHPATVREDGKAAHLGARQMKELAAYLLQTYPLPPYPCHWKVERGTATLAEAVKLALAELFDNRIKVHYTSMIGDSMKGGWRNDQRPHGYKEKAKGNSRGKGSHEAHNRLFHTQASHLPGQTGAHYGIRPAVLNASVEECREIWNLRQRLPEHKRGDVLFPLVVLQTEARDVIRQFCLDQNFRTEHNLQGFEKVLEWWDGAKWQPRETAPAGVQFRSRMESPVERATRLIRDAGDARWTRPCPSVIKTFLEHTERIERVEDNGEIKMTIDGVVKKFSHGGVPLVPGTKVLAYLHPEDPAYLHLTSGDGRFLGTWYQRGLVPAMDQQALAQAMRHTHAAHAAAQQVAHDLAAPERAELEAMRAHNASLLDPDPALENFVVVTEPVSITGSGTLPLTLGATPVSATFVSHKDQKKISRNADRQRDEDERIAREALANLIK